MISFQVTYTESTQTRVVKLTELTAYPVGSTVKIFDNSSDVGGGYVTSSGVWSLYSDVDIPASKLPDQVILYRHDYSQPPKYDASSLPSASSVPTGTELVVGSKVVKSTGTALVSAFNNRAGRPKLCFVGSSLTQHGNNIGISKLSTDTRGWPFWLMAMLQDSAIAEQWVYTDPVSSKRYSVGSNRGVSAQYASVIDARIGDAAAMNADIYIVQQGTNDLAGLDVSTTIAAVTSTTKKLRDTGALVVLLTEPCRSFSAGTGWNLGGKAVLQREALNQAKRDLARTEIGVICVESDKYIMQATGESKTGYQYDGTHFSPIGAYNWALAIYEALVPTYITLKPKIINAAGVYNATYNPMGNLLPNPILATAASGYTKSTLPTGITSFTIVNNADGSVTVTIVTDGTGVAGDISGVYLTLHPSRLFNIGECLQLGVKVRSIIQADNLYSIKPAIKQQLSGVNIDYIFGGEKYISPSYVGSKTTYLPTTNVPLYIKTPRSVILNNGTDIYAQVYFEVNAGIVGTNSFILEGFDLRQTDLPWDVVGVSKTLGYSTQPYYGSADI